MNSIEEKLWNYIDGTCSVEEHTAIANLIDTDEAYRRKYDELLTFNAEMGQMELEEPSMGFTFKVMEAVRTEVASVPLKAAINKNVIKGLVGIFVFVIGVLIVYAMFSINWSTGNNGAVSDYKIPALKIPSLSAATDNFLLKGTVFFMTVLALLFVDTYLRKQREASRV